MALTLLHKWTIQSENYRAKAKTKKFEKIMERLINCYNDLNMLDTNGWSSLHYTCFLGNLSLSQYLIDSTCNLNIQTREVYKKIPKGSTPLHIAVTSNNADVAKYLLLKHADATITDQDGNTALHLALSKVTQRNMTQVIESLINHGCHKEMRNKYGQTPLHYYVTHTRSVDLDVKCIAIINLFIVPNDIDNCGITLLQSAVTNGKIDIIKIFLTNTTVHSWDYINYAKKPISIFSVDLIWYFKTCNIFRCLKKRIGIVSQIQDNIQLTALQIAVVKRAYNGYTLALHNILRMILQCGGDVHVKYSNQDTILQQTFYRIRASKDQNCQLVAFTNIYCVFILLSAGAKYEGHEYVETRRNMEMVGMQWESQWNSYRDKVWTFTKIIQLLGYKFSHSYDGLGESSPDKIEAIEYMTAVFSLEVLAARVIRTKLYPNAWVAAKELPIPLKLYIKHFEIFMNTPHP